MNPDDTQDATQDFLVSGRIGGASPDGTVVREGRRGPSQHSSRSAGSSTTRRTRKQRNSLGEINAGRDAAPCVLKSPGRPSNADASRVSTGSHRRSVHFGTVKVVPIPARPSVALRMAQSATPESFELEVATPTNGPPNDENFALLPHGHTGTTMIVGAPPSAGAVATTTTALPSADRRPFGAHRPVAQQRSYADQGASPLNSQALAAPASGPLVRGTGWGAPGVLVDDDDDDDGRIATPLSNPPSPPKQQVSGPNEDAGTLAVPTGSSAAAVANVSSYLSDNDDSQGIDELLLQAQAQRVRRMNDDVAAIKARRATDASAAALAELDDMTPFEDTLVALPPRNSLLFERSGAGAVGPTPPSSASALPTQAQRSQPLAPPLASQTASLQSHAPAPTLVAPSGSIPPLETTSAEAIRRVSPLHEALPAPPVPRPNAAPLQMPSSYTGLGVASQRSRAAADLPLSPFSALHARGGGQGITAAPSSSSGSGAGIASPLFDSAPTAVPSPPGRGAQTGCDEVVAPSPTDVSDGPSPVSLKPFTRLSAVAAPTQLVRQLPPASAASEDSGDIDLLAPGGADQWLQQRAMREPPRVASNTPSKPREPSPSTTQSSLTTSSDDDATTAEEASLVAAVVPVGSRQHATESPLLHPVASAPRFDARMKMSSATADDDEDDEVAAVAEAGADACSPSSSTSSGSSGDDDDDDMNDALLVPGLVQGGKAAAAPAAAPARRGASHAMMRGSADFGTASTAVPVPLGGGSAPGSSESQPFPLAQAPVVADPAITSTAGSLATLTGAPSPASYPAAVPPLSKPTVTPSPREGAGHGGFTIDPAALSSLWDAALGEDDDASADHAHGAPQALHSQLPGASGGDFPTPSLVGGTSATLTKTVSLSDAPDAVRFTVGVSADELTPSLPSGGPSATPLQRRCALCDGAAEEDRGLLPLTVGKERATAASKVELTDALATAVVEIGGGDGGGPSGSGAAMVVMGRPPCGSKDLHHLEWHPVFVHFDCAVWSPEVYSEQADGAHPGDPPRVLMHHVAAAIDRGSRIKCAACRQIGATLGCVVATCQRSYHYPCAVVAAAAACKHRESEGASTTDSAAAAVGEAKLVMDLEALTVKCARHDRRRSVSAARSVPDACERRPKEEDHPMEVMPVSVKPHRARKQHAGKRAKSPGNGTADTESTSTTTKTAQPRARRQPRRSGTA